MIGLWIITTCREANKMLYLEHSFVMCQNLDTLESRPGVFWKFLDVVLEKDGEDHSVRSCERRNLHGVKEERNNIHTII